MSESLWGSRIGIRTLIVLMAAVVLAACGSSTGVDSGAGSGSGQSRAKTFVICPSENATAEALIAFFDAREGDTIEFCEGHFDITTGLIVNGKKGITIKGAGIDKTYLSFENSDSSEGLNIAHADGIVMEGFTVQDTPGNGIRVYRSKYVTFRAVRALWSDYATCSTDPEAENTCAHHGAYGLYPVESKHVLIEDSESWGASDAGIYVGQTSDVIVRRTRAEYNVAGFEFENTYRAVFEDNIATNNVGGFLVFDLPGLSQYGEGNIIRRNKAYRNNMDNFAPIGNIVGIVPRGTGILVLSTDNLEIYDNDIYEHDTIGLAVVNYALADPGEPDLKYDFYPEGIHIHGNRFRDNTMNMAEPDLDRGEATLLPLLLRLKNLGRGAHIVWDGAVDTPNDCDQFPVDADGIPLNQPNPVEEARYEPRTNALGRPNYRREDPEPACKYNAWKFDEHGDIKPQLGLYVGEDNTFENTMASTALATDFLNAKLTTSALPDLLLELLKPASTNLAPHRGSLPAVTVRELDLPYVPNLNGANARPTEAQIKSACNGGSSGAVNFSAAARYNCPLLSQYRLFEDASDPTTGAVGGVKYDLNTPLFTDYASKHRFIFLPPGTHATYLDHHDDITATLDFPLGTIIAKTFAYEKDGVETMIETRLLIKREVSGEIVWVGLPYLWQTDSNGKRYAELKIEGAKVPVEYDYEDHDTDVDAHYSGASDKYEVPAALHCLYCHAGDHREAGAAPIGPKVRNINKDFDYGDAGVVNQLVHLKALGLLEGLPADFDNVERLPRWNVPGDGGDTPNSAADIQHRVRAFFEVNCMHCHNAAGAGSNSGLFLDSFRPVDHHYGICKRPVAAGKGSGGRLYDIIPGDADGSILPYRLASTEPGVRMPPIARTVAQGEAINLVASWINTVLPTDDTQDYESCYNSGVSLADVTQAEFDGLMKRAMAGETIKLTSADQRRAKAGQTADAAE
jgi:parallel beta-helix repeat protein